MLFIGYRWLDDRIAIRDVFDDVGSKYVPPHVNIFYCFGGLEERFCVWPSLGWYTEWARLTFMVSRVDELQDLLPYVMYER